MIDKVAPEADYLTETQVAQLLRAINPRRVGTYEKNAKLKLAHVEAYELRAHLNRILGFARWSEDVLDQQFVFHREEERQGNNGPYTMHTVVYRSIVRLTVCAPSGKTLATYTEGATGDATGSTLADTHDQALKTSASQAFKRCCANLGDQFGLSLYAKGSRAALVKQTLLMPDVAPASEGVDEHVEESVPEDDTVTPEPETRQTNNPTHPSVPVTPPAPVDHPVPPEQEVSPDKEAERRAKAAQEVRDQALAGPQDDTTPNRFLSHLTGVALKGGLLQERVSNAFGAEVTLKVFLEECLKNTARGKQGSPAPEAAAR